jgi:hypothetical protein
MGRQNVTVTHNGTALTITPLSIELQTGDWVDWSFVGVQSNELVYILFEDEPLGPFQSLSPSSHNVVGQGNSGSSGTHPYKAILMDSAGALAISGEGAVVMNSTGGSDASPEVAVHLNGTTGMVDLVAPHAVMLFLGQTVNWHIHSLPAGHFVTLLFDGFPDPMMGPFSLLTVSLGVADPAIRLIRGEGFGLGLETLAAEISYFIQVRDAAGSIIDTHDPVIDNLGTPPGPPPP